MFAFRSNDAPEETDRWIGRFVSEQVFFRDKIARGRAARGGKEGGFRFARKREYTSIIHLPMRESDGLRQLPDIA